MQLTIRKVFTKNRKKQRNEIKKNPYKIRVQEYKLIDFRYCAKLIILIKI